MVTGTTGQDAVHHSMEAYTKTKFHQADASPPSCSLFRSFHFRLWKSYDFPPCFSFLLRDDYKRRLGDDAIRLDRRGHGRKQCCLLALLLMAVDHAASTVPRGLDVQSLQS
jgi:hypothetical protein